MALGKTVTGIHPDAFAMLTAYSWPGNLRELHRVIQSVVLFVEGNTVRPEHILLDQDDDDIEPPESTASTTGVHDPRPPVTTIVDGHDYTLLTAELVHISQVYAAAGYNKSKSASLLGVTRATLDRKLAIIRDREAAAQ